MQINNIEIGNDKPLVLIAGPCQMESEDHAIYMAESLVKITKKLGIDFIYKASFDKANRTSLQGKRGIGWKRAKPVFEEIKNKLGIPIITDVHKESECEEVAETVDVLQIPAFLCRQTDLLVSAAKTKKAINVKKGQFLAPWDMKNVVAKIKASGNGNVMLCDRGTSFGYNTLVSDMRALPIMAKTGCPVVFDATHSVQQPGGLGGASGGEREFVPVLARAAVSVGIAAIFIETHEAPDTALSDAGCMLPLDDMESLLLNLIKLDCLTKKALDVSY